MAACERCWEDAQAAGGRAVTVAGVPFVDCFEAYRRLINERSGVNKCTPEQQAGRDAKACPLCKRQTIHQYANCCMVPGCFGEVKPQPRNRQAWDAAPDHDFGVPGAAGKR